MITTWSARDFILGSKKGMKEEIGRKNDDHQNHRHFSISQKIFFFLFIFQFCFSLKISTFKPHCYDRNNRNYDFYKKARWYFWVSKYVVWRSLCWLTSENLISGIGKWTFLFRNLFLVSFKFLFWEIFWSTHYWRKMICKPIKQLRFETANNDINDAVFRMLGTDIIFLIILNLRNLEIWEHSSFFNY